MPYVFGDYTLDVERRELRCRGQVVQLRPKVLDLLVYLISHRDQAVTKQTLLTQLWPNLYVSPATLSACIKLARQAVGDSGTMQHSIQTLHGRGYRFVALVVERAPRPSGDSTPPVPEPSPQGRVGAADRGPERPVRVAEAPLPRDVLASTGEWKLVTVLCGALAAPPTEVPLELETHYRKVSALYALAWEAVQRYGGTLQPVVGDQILALFGAPLAQEAHAQRAALAALELQRRVHEAERAPSTQPHPRLEVRLGLHTGHIAVGVCAEASEGMGAVVGDTVTRACALQAQADPGTIRCSRATARLVHEVVQVAAVAPAPMARASPLDTVYTVLGRRASGRHLGLQEGRVLTPFIGRTPALATLHALAAQVEEGRGQVVGILGEPGMGKTRLCAEFIRGQLAQPWCRLATQAIPYDQAIPYGPVMALLKDYFQVEERATAPVVRDQVTTSLLTLDPAFTPLAPPILALLEVPVEDSKWQALEPPQRREQTFQALKHLLLRASQVQPLLVVMENCHWLDTETQACLDLLVESVPTARLLLLLTYRPDYQHGWGNKTYYTQLRLDPLPRPQAHAFLDALLGEEVGLQPLKQQVIALTQGNPFFLEESVQTLIETGAVDGARGAYCLGQPLPMIRVPATVQAVLAARLDRLPSEEKHLLQIAAVIGMEVPFALLQALVEWSEAELRRSLAHLQAVEFLYETSFFPERVYTFKHALTQQVAYASLLQERRRVLHARIVEALEALAWDQVAEQVERQALHALRGEVWEKAVVYCQRAGARAHDRAAFHEAVAAFEQAIQALAHLPEDGDTRVLAIEFRLALGGALTQLGEYRRSLTLLGEAETLARTLDDRARLGQVLAWMAHVLRLTGDPDGAMEAGQQALALAAELSAGTVQGQASLSLGLAYHALGDFGRATESLRWIMEAADRASGMPRIGLRIHARAWLALTLGALGAFAEGRRHGEEALRRATLAGRGNAPTVAHSCLGHLYLAQGDLAHAIRVLEQGLALCRASGDRTNLRLITAGLGHTSALQGRLAEGRVLLEEAISEDRRTGALANHARWVTWLSEVSRLAGRGEEAWQYARQALALARQHKERANEALALHQLGVVYAHADPPEVAQAAASYQQALALADALGMRPLQAHCHRSLGMLYATTGQQEPARTALSTASAMYHAMEMTFWLPETEAALAQVEGR